MKKTMHLLAEACKRQSTIPVALQGPRHWVKAWSIARIMEL